MAGVAAKDFVDRLRIVTSKAGKKSETEFLVFPAPLSPLRLKARDIRELVQVTVEGRHRPFFGHCRCRHATRPQNQRSGFL